MTDERPRQGADELSPSERVDEICDRFEQIWATGQRPAIDDFLLEVKDSLRETLFRELFAVEVERRQSSGEILKRSDYLLRFPDYQTVIDEHFDDPARPFDVPRHIGQYEVLSELGRGGMGSVYRVRHQSLQKEFALKVLPEALSQDPEAVARFRREIVLQGKLDHPNLVAATDAGELDRLHYLVMEYVPGETLRERVAREGPMSIPDACQVIREAATGLDYAHRHGLVHRDVKPSNLMLTSSPAKPVTSEVDSGSAIGRSVCLNVARVRVLDMGLARLRQTTPPDGDAVTTTGNVMGTIDYMSPEQAESPRETDARADIYSLGCTLFFALTGKPVYGGDSVMKRLLAHREKPIPSLQPVRSDVPDELDSIYQRMIAKDPADRFQSMSELIEAIDKVAVQSRSTNGAAAPERLPSCVETDLVGIDDETVAYDSVSGTEKLSGAGLSQTANSRRSPKVVFGLLCVFLLLPLVWNVSGLAERFGETTSTETTSTAPEALPEAGARKGTDALKTAPAALSSVNGDTDKPQEEGDQSDVQNLRRFVVSEALRSLTFSTDVAFGDVDNDRDIDLIAVSDQEQKGQVFLNSGRGKFLPGRSLQNSGNGGIFPGRDIAMNHLLNGRKPDLFVISHEGDFSVWTNDKQGGFRKENRAVKVSDCNAVLTGDLNGDERPDAIILSAESYPHRVLLSDGNGALADSGITLGKVAANAVALGDLDADGDQDAILAVSAQADQESRSGQTVWLNKGDGGFDPLKALFPESGAADVALGDFDRDGDLDAVFACVDSPPEIWLNDGKAHFQQLDGEFADLSIRSVEAADFDDDGAADIATISDDGMPVIWWNDGNAGFAQQTELSDGANAAVGLAFVDIDSDGDLDVFVDNGPEVGDGLWINQRYRPEPNGSELTLVGLPEDLATERDVRTARIKIHSPDWELSRYVHCRKELRYAALSSHDRELYLAFSGVRENGLTHQGGLFRLRKGKAPEPLVRDDVFRFLFSPDGTRCFYDRSYRGVIVEWDTASRMAVREIDLTLGNDGPATSSFRPDWCEDSFLMPDEYVFADFGGNDVTGGIWKWGQTLEQPVKLFGAEREAAMFSLAVGRDCVFAGASIGKPVDNFGQLFRFDGVNIQTVDVRADLYLPCSMIFDPETGDLLIAAMDADHVDRLKADGNGFGELTPFVTGIDGIRIAALSMTNDGEQMVIADYHDAYVLSRRR